jgi:hypothetical protein
MADPRAESILSALSAVLSGLPKTGTNIQRGQIYAHEAGKLPAVALFMGDDVVIQEHQSDRLDWELQVIIESTVTIAAAYTTFESGIETELNQIRNEVHAAIMADHTQGLPYVIDTTPVSASRPVLQDDGTLPTGSQSLEFVIQYQTTRNDVSA